MEMSVRDFMMGIEPIKMVKKPRSTLTKKQKEKRAKKRDQRKKSVRRNRHG